jgi:hypothetical protein
VALVTWDGTEITSCGTGTAGDQALIKLHLHDPHTLMRLVLDPQFQFGELYSCGHLEVDGDLVALIESIFAAQGTRQGFRNYFWLYSR